MECSDDDSIGSASEFEYEDQSDLEGDLAGDADDDPMVIEPPEVRKSPYLVFESLTEISDRQTRCINDARELLDVDAGDAFFLLRFFGWDLARLQEAWFANDLKVRDRCGLSNSSLPSSSSSSSGKCPICQETVAQLVSLSCNHGFCSDCWRGYLHCQVDDGKATIQARCPQHKCERVVPKDLFVKFCDQDRKAKYEEWYVRSYVDDNLAMRWCTNPVGCQAAIEYQGVDPIEVRCKCDFLFCWACGEEAHRPSDCKTVCSWNIKNSAESENISWISANTKQCPKCHRAIEKNQGCNHMVCSRAGGCGHEFCWLCLGDWATHGTSTGGYYQCNIYDKQAKEGKHAEEETSRQRAKHALDKYMFYFERFMEHDKSMHMTVKAKAEVDNKVQKLHDVHGFEIIELQFLYDALRQVRACRRVLKWTYVYGYYLDENSAEKNLFEHLQRNIEEKTDLLHGKLENDLDKIFEEGPNGIAPDAHQKWKTFRSDVTNFTNVTQKFREQILADITSTGSLSMETAAPSSAKPAFDSVRNSWSRWAQSGK